MTYITKIKLKDAEKLAEVWRDATSMDDAFKRAGFGTKDGRTQRRYRRLAEKLLGNELPTINRKFKTDVPEELVTNLKIKELSLDIK